MENFGQARPALQRQQVYACFIDFQKAYDSVWHNGMFHKLSTKINGSFLYT